jgi:hypothetical protein
MLRVTVHEGAQAITFQIEGRLAGQWVREMEACWRNTLASCGKSAVRVDLTGVTLVDAAGKECLQMMHDQGAEFIAADCMTKCIVAEITRAPIHDNEHRRFAGEGRQ